MTTSILDDTKKVLNMAPDYTAFDQDIIMHINSVFSTLNQLGVGPDGGFQITDRTTMWSDFLGNDPRLNNVKTYMYLRVKSWFDPPTLRYVVGALDNQIKELEWRINAQRETIAWTDPNPNPSDSIILDGGTP